MSFSEWLLCSLVIKMNQYSVVLFVFVNFERITAPRIQIQVQKVFKKEPVMSDRRDKLMEVAYLRFISTHSLSSETLTSILHAELLRSSLCLRSFAIYKRTARCFHFFNLFQKCSYLNIRHIM